VACPKDTWPQTAENVPGRAQNRPHQHHDHQVQEERRRDEPGHRHEQKNQCNNGKMFHDLPTPNNPEGLNSSTRRKITKPMPSLYGTET
jgi:hypothetical protein